MVIGPQRERAADARLPHTSRNWCRGSQLSRGPFLSSQSEQLETYEHDHHHEARRH